MLAIRQNQTLGGRARRCADQKRSTFGGGLAKGAKPAKTIEPPVAVERALAGIGVADAAEVQHLRIERRSAEIVLQIPT